MKEKSHRVSCRCYESGVETHHGTQTRRLDGHSLYSAEHAAGPRDFEADRRPLRPAPGQLRRRRDSAEGGRRSARAHLALAQGQVSPSRSSTTFSRIPPPSAVARGRAGEHTAELQSLTKIRY